MPFIPNIGPGELILILVIALVVLGPSKLPDVANSLGRSLREFRKAASDVSDAAKVDAPAPAAQAPAASAAPAPNMLSSTAQPNTLATPSAAPIDAPPSGEAVAAGSSTSPESSGR